MDHPASRPHRVEPPARKRPVEHDCTECRLTGTALCLGIASYAWLQRYQLKPHEMRNRSWLGLFAGGWLVAGLWRFNYTPGAPQQE